MSTENERCAPKKVGLAADVDRLLRQHAQPRPEPKRYEVPTESGVYRAVSDWSDIRVQLDETGQWWPYPYSFSGWRTSEMSLFRLTALPELEMDVPEIRNPEIRSAVEYLAEKLSEAFPEIGDDRIREFALKHVTESW